MGEWETRALEILPEVLARQAVACASVPVTAEALRG
jgi:hypothetical protein